MEAEHFVKDNSHDLEVCNVGTCTLQATLAELKLPRFKFYLVPRNLSHLHLWCAPTSRLHATSLLRLISRCKVWFHEKWLSKTSFPIADTSAGPTNTKIYHDSLPPLYAMRIGFTFSLDRVLKDETASMSLEPTAFCENTTLIQELTSKVEFDKSIQTRSLQH